MSTLLSHLRRGLGENFRFAFLAVRAHKLRAVLTVLGIVVGVSTVIAMVSIVTGFKNNMIRSFQSFGATLVQFQKFEQRFGPHGPPEAELRRKDLQLEDALALKASIPEMRAVSPERYLWDTDIHVKYRDAETTTPVVAGVGPDYPMANNHFVSYGRFITEADFEHATTVAVIGEDVRSVLFPREDPLGKPIDFNGMQYTVIGVLEKKGRMFGGSNDNFLLIPFTAFDRQFPWIKNSHRDTIHIATVPYTPEQVPIILEKGRELLRARRHVPFDKPDDFAIFTPDRMIENFKAITNGVMLAMVFIAGVSLLDRGRRRDEHHARVGDRAHPRDRPPQGGGRVPARHRPAVSDGGDHALAPRRRDRRGARHRGTRRDQTSVRGTAGGDANLGDRRGTRGVDLRRHLLRAVSGGEGFAAGPDRSAAIRVTRTR